MNEGWICLYRKIEDNPIVCKDNDYFRVWIYLLLNATHRKIDKIFGKERITLKPGQLITGRDVIAAKCKIKSSSKVYRILNGLEKGQQIEQKTNSKGTLITIINWNSYQQYEHESEQQKNNDCTTNELQMNTNNNETTKQILDSSSSSLFEYVEEKFGRPLSPSELEKIALWENNDLTRYAIKQAELARAFSVKYIEAILNRYKIENISTIAEAENREKEFKKNKTTKNIPDWFNKKVEDSELSEMEKQELERILAEFR